MITKLSVSIFLMSIIACNLHAAEMMHNPAILLGPENSGFLDKSQYNAADHAGSPLGWLESDSSSFKTDLFFRYFRLKDESGKNSATARSLAIPHIRLGNPGIATFDLIYNPDILERKSENNKQKLPLHRFGLGIAAGSKSGLFQVGLKADMFVGKESQDNNENQRFIIGSDELSLHIGSQVHELVRIGFHGGVNGYFDSLIYQDTSVQDRFFSGTFPLFGGFIDIGKDNFPVRSNFYLNFGFPKFVYVVKPSFKPFGNQDVIRGDSINWDWKTIADIPAGNFTIKPAFQIGYRRSTSQLYLPEEDNYPWQHASELTDSNWTIKSFGMGFGVGSDFLQFVEINLEYSFNHLSVENGPAFNSYPDQNNWYHHIAFGLQGNMHRIAQLRIPESMKLKVRTEYFNFRQNEFTDPWRADLFTHVSQISSGSQQARYMPGAYAMASRMVGINTAIGSSFLNGMFGVDTDFMFLRDGFQFGVNVFYNLSKHKEL